MDEDHVAEIYNYFNESETDSLKTAIKELGSEYSEEEIRLVRVKFLSEMANWFGNGYNKNTISELYIR